MVDRRQDWTPRGQKPVRERTITKLEWGQDLGEASSIWVKDQEGHEWVWQKGKEIESHDPADRVGGPFRLTGYVSDGSGEHFFIFAVVDSYFPIHDLVRADSWEDAYEAYIDYAANHRHIAIEEPDLKDYDPKDLHYTSRGVPVDTDNIQGGEARFVRAEGIPDEEA